MSDVSSSLFIQLRGAADSALTPTQLYASVSAETRNILSPTRACSLVPLVTQYNTGPDTCELVLFLLKLLSRFLFPAGSDPEKHSDDSKCSGE